MLNVDGALRLLNEAVSELERDYSRDRRLILSEGDLNCLLHRRLSDSLSQSAPTAAHQVPGIQVHTTISWYDEDGYLGIRPDISIVDPELLSVDGSRNIALRHSRIAPASLPSKGFEYRGSAVVVELKFVRTKGDNPHIMKPTKPATARWSNW